MSVGAAIWRIAAETREFAADDLSGGGAARYPGRWNEAGQRVVYCATTLSLAVLETAAHVQRGGLPLNRFVVRVEVPEEVWKAREVLRVQDLEPAWAAIPAGRASVRAGSGWFKAGASALLLVPSVIVPEELNVLVNATHPDAARLGARVLRPFEYDRVLR